MPGLVVQKLQPPPQKTTDGDLGGASEDAENRGEEGANEGGGSTEKHDEGMSDTSILDSDLSGFNISPDDIVGVIGPKHFWKARRTIVK